MPISHARLATISAAITALTTAAGHAQPFVEDTVEVGVLADAPIGDAPLIGFVTGFAGTNFPIDLALYRTEDPFEQFPSGLLDSLLGDSGSRFLRPGRYTLYLAGDGTFFGDDIDDVVPDPLPFGNYEIDIDGQRFTGSIASGGVDRFNFTITSPDVIEDTTSVGSLGVSNPATPMNALFRTDFPGTRLESISLALYDAAGTLLDVSSNLDGSPGNGRIETNLPPGDYTLLVGDDVIYYDDLIVNSERFFTDSGTYVVELQGRIFTGFLPRERVDRFDFTVDPTTEQDSDLDGVIDTLDNCPDTPNPDQTDADNDGTGDACEERGFITIINPGFEDPVLADDTSTTEFPAFGWLARNFGLPAEIRNPGPADGFAAPQGDNVAIPNESEVLQTLPVPFRGNTRYILTASVSIPDSATFLATPLMGIGIADQFGNLQDLTGSFFSQFPMPAGPGDTIEWSITFDVLPGDEFAIGEPIVIGFRDFATDPLDALRFDNFRLFAMPFNEAVRVPEDVPELQAALTFDNQRTIDLAPGTYELAVGGNGNITGRTTDPADAVVILLGSSIRGSIQNVSAIDGFINIAADSNGQATLANAILDTVTVSPRFNVTGEINITGVTATDSTFQMRTPTNIDTSTFAASTLTIEADTTITNSTFERSPRSAISAGDGIPAPRLTIDNSNFLGNTNDLFGGAIDVIGGPGVTIRNSRFLGNTADFGGAINIESTNLTLEQVTLTNNDAIAGGSIYLGPGATATIDQSTIVNNTALFGDAVFQDRFTQLDVANSIIAGSPTALLADPISLQTAQYSIIQGDATGTGVLNQNPSLARLPSDGGDGFGDDPNTPQDESANDDPGDLTPLANSPAIDAGNNNRVPTNLTLDAAGNPRFFDDASVQDTGLGNAPIVDIGAIERQQDSPCPACNPADLVDTFGILDLADVDAFITAFANQDPIADIATNFGVIDLADIDAFITNFLAGCP